MADFWSNKEKCRSWMSTSTTFFFFWPKMCQRGKKAIWIMSWLRKKGHSVLRLFYDFFFFSFWNRLTIKLLNNKDLYLLPQRTAPSINKNNFCANLLLFGLRSSIFVFVTFTIPKTLFHIFPNKRTDGIIQPHTRSVKRILQNVQFYNSSLFYSSTFWPKIFHRTRLLKRNEEKNKVIKPNKTQ